MKSENLLKSMTKKNSDLDEKFKKNETKISEISNSMKLLSKTSQERADI